MRFAETHHRLGPRLDAFRAAVDGFRKGSTHPTILILVARFNQNEGGCKAFEFVGAALIGANLTYHLECGNRM